MFRLTSRMSPLSTRTKLSLSSSTGAQDSYTHVSTARWPLLSNGAKRKLEVFQNVTSYILPNSLTFVCNKVTRMGLRSAMNQEFIFPLSSNLVLHAILRTLPILTFVTLTETKVRLYIVIRTRVCWRTFHSLPAQGELLPQLEKFPLTIK